MCLATGAHGSSSLPPEPFWDVLKAEEGSGRGWMRVSTGEVVCLAIEAHDSSSLPREPFLDLTLKPWKWRAAACTR